MSGPAYLPTAHWNLDSIVSGLRQARVAWRGPRGRLREDAGLREFPSQEALRQIIKDLCGALFPMRLGPIDLREEVEDFYVGHTIGAALDALLHQVNLELQYVGRDDPAQQAVSQQRAIDIVRQFGAELPRVRAALDLDVTAAYQGDPAAHSVDEVLLCYPGVAAMIHHRLANVLYRLGVPMLARIVAEIAHADTGIDIHPGATIGRSFFIDHGTGVVIGETAIIGDRVRLYQMVTLGAKRFPPGENGELKKGLARHPLIEDDVVIYAGATILGRVTIGKGSTIGGNVWLTRSVPPGSNVTQASLVSDMPDCGLGG
ncbi:serine O-acetyltransferase EpsC [Achromobacter xylosoxidans]|jgi:serine O-acetyltransferase|uniref:serine O-acetyltransferase n=6 Tax=Alcaligenes xylosoxydans xylosoxydans TaxID=85698 RepID=A0A0D6IB54_ALCXX|nr:MULTISPECIES: serine O-acetyltransferase EpsC [Achromobacter]AHC48789.1 Serine acetyltransferase [Achromobacter xylosoxidans NBRC 15126 = ATCC 27061]AMH04558.1 serine acetyltransferase [Achromobacter xylosoxidans]AXA78939.1 serine acetyltransferase [Achromobacter xylosoxidans]EFV84021.1 SrpH protein [Achromobacter xylosoxidans C54]KAA5926165.1 serine acetyltransferase [Achromobacter xylosoxidans]